MNLTKLDVLSELEEIKVGVAYRLPDGTLLPTVPSDLDKLEKCEVRGGDDVRRSGKTMPRGGGGNVEGCRMGGAASCCLFLSWASG